MYPEQMTPDAADFLERRATRRAASERRRGRAVDVPLFGAEDLRAIERVNAEIERNGRRARRAETALPLLDA